MNCHCRVKKHFHAIRGKKLGLIGVVLMILHLLYHVAGFLFFPAAFVALHDQFHHHDTAYAESGENVSIDNREETPDFLPYFADFDVKDTFLSPKLTLVSGK